MTSMPEPLVANHDDMVVWAKKYLGPYAEVRSVAMHTDGKKWTWSINLKEGVLQPQIENVPKMRSQVQKMLDFETNLSIKVEALCIWLPCSMKRIWQIGLVRTN